MKSQTKKLLIIVIFSVFVIFLALLGYRYLEYNKTETGSEGGSDKMITSFQDPSGWFYECSKPIPAKRARILHGDGTSRRELIAANPEDVKLYCHRNSIE